MSQTNPKGARGEIRNKGIAAARRERRRVEAEERQAEHDKRSVTEQYALMKKRPGNSKREHEKLLARKGRKKNER